MACFWIYTIVWIFALIYVSILWGVSWQKRIIPFLLLVMGTPAIEDLLISYNGYKKMWEDHNKALNKDLL
jgi:hypothetical protein